MPLHRSRTSAGGRWRKPVGTGVSRGTSALRDSRRDFVRVDGVEETCHRVDASNQGFGTHQDRGR
jgi:hypothetical protein